MAQITDEAVKEATGKTWNEWFLILDKAEADKWSHKQIAEWLKDQDLIESGWWRQGVTVEYERARGLRQVHETLNGFAASVSKTLDISTDDLFDWFYEPAKRKKWCSYDLEVTKATKPKSLRAKLPDKTRVSIGFYIKEQGKSQVALQHEKLKDEYAVNQAKEAWKSCIEKLAGITRNKKT